MLHFSQSWVLYNFSRLAFCFPSLQGDCGCGALCHCTHSWECLSPPHVNDSWSSQSIFPSKLERFSPKEFHESLTRTHFSLCRQSFYCLSDVGFSLHSALAVSPGCLYTCSAQLRPGGPLVPCYYPHQNGFPHLITASLWTTSSNKPSPVTLPCVRADLSLNPSSAN